MSSNPSINRSLGAKVKSLRNKNNITREVLAESIGVSSRFLADVESGKVGISLATLIGLCRELGVSSDYLLGITENHTFSDKEEIYDRIDHIPADQLEPLIRIIKAYSDAVNK